MGRAELGEPEGAGLRRGKCNHQHTHQSRSNQRLVGCIRECKKGVGYLFSGTDEIPAPGPDVGAKKND